MDLELDGHVAVVTGASRGIGLAVTKALAREGVRVVAGARSIDSLGLDQVLPVRVDLADPDGPAALVERAVAEYGRLDHLVNNVGQNRGGPPASVLSITDEQWEQALQVNLLIAVRACRAAGAHLIAARGSVVNVSSTSALSPTPMLADYSAAKAALTSFSRSLSMELGPQGVRVISVSPGPTTTSMWDGAPEDLKRALADQASLGRFSTPEHVADTVAFLISPRSASTTGSDHVIDAGLGPITGPRLLHSQAARV